jgi:cystathionine gamma-synthase
MTHAPVSEQALAAAGIRQNLIRLSVGVESGEDLAADVGRPADAEQLSVAPVASAVGGLSSGAAMT